MEEDAGTQVRRTARARKVNPRFVGDDIDENYMKLVGRITASDYSGKIDKDSSAELSSDGLPDGKGDENELVSKDDSCGQNTTLINNLSPKSTNFETGTFNIALKTVSLKKIKKNKKNTDEVKDGSKPSVSIIARYRSSTESETSEDLTESCGELKRRLSAAEESSEHLKRVRVDNDNSLRSPGGESTGLTSVRSNVSASLPSLHETKVVSQQNSNLSENAFPTPVTSRPDVKSPFHSVLNPFVSISNKLDLKQPKIVLSSDSKLNLPGKKLKIVSLKPIATLKENLTPEGRASPSLGSEANKLVFDQDGPLELKIVKKESFPLASTNLPSIVNKALSAPKAKVGLAKAPNHSNNSASDHCMPSDGEDDIPLKKLIQKKGTSKKKQLVQKDSKLQKLKKGISHKPNKIDSKKVNDQDDLPLKLLMKNSKSLVKSSLMKKKSFLKKQQQAVESSRKKDKFSKMESSSLSAKNKVSKLKKSKPKISSGKEDSLTTLNDKVPLSSLKIKHGKSSKLKHKFKNLDSKISPVMKKGNISLNSKKINKSKLKKLNKLRFKFPQKKIKKDVPVANETTNIVISVSGLEGDYACVAIDKGHIASAGENSELVSRPKDTAKVKAKRVVDECSSSPATKYTCNSGLVLEDLSVEDSSDVEVSSKELTFKKTKDNLEIKSSDILSLESTKSKTFPIKEAKKIPPADNSNTESPKIKFKIPKDLNKKLDIRPSIFDRPPQAGKEAPESKDLCKSGEAVVQLVAAQQATDGQHLRIKEEFVERSGQTDVSHTKFVSPNKADLDKDKYCREVKKEETYSSLQIKPKSKHGDKPDIKSEPDCKNKEKQKGEKYKKADKNCESPKSVKESKKPKEKHIKTEKGRPSPEASTFESQVGKTEDKSMRREKTEAVKSEKDSVKLGGDSGERDTKADLSLKKDQDSSRDGSLTPKTKRKGNFEEALSSIPLVKPTKPKFSHDKRGDRGDKKLSKEKMKDVKQERTDDLNVTKEMESKRKKEEKHRHKEKKRERSKSDERRKSGYDSDHSDKDRKQHREVKKQPHHKKYKKDHSGSPHHRSSSSENRKRVKKEKGERGSKSHKDRLISELSENTNMVVVKMEDRQVVVVSCTNDSPTRIMNTVCVKDDFNVPCMEEAPQRDSLEKWKVKPEVIIDEEYLINSSTNNVKEESYSLSQQEAIEGTIKTDPSALEEQEHPQDMKKSQEQIPTNGNGSVKTKSQVQCPKVKQAPDEDIIGLGEGPSETDPFGISQNKYVEEYYKNKENDAISDLGILEELKDFTEKQKIEVTVDSSTTAITKEAQFKETYHSPEAERDINLQKREQNLGVSSDSLSFDQLNVDKNLTQEMKNEINVKLSMSLPSHAESKKEFVQRDTSLPVPSAALQITTKETTKEMIGTFSEECVKISCEGMEKKSTKEVVKSLADSSATNSLVGEVSEESSNKLVNKKPAEQAGIISTESVVEYLAKSKDHLTIASLETKTDISEQVSYKAAQEIFKGTSSEALKDALVEARKDFAKEVSNNTGTHNSKNTSNEPDKIFDKATENASKQSLLNIETPSLSEIVKESSSNVIQAVSLVTPNESFKEAPKPSLDKDTKSDFEEIDNDLKSSKPDSKETGQNLKPSKLESSTTDKNSTMETSLKSADPPTTGDKGEVIKESSEDDKTQKGPTNDSLNEATSLKGEESTEKVVKKSVATQKKHKSAVSMMDYIYRSVFQFAPIPEETTETAELSKENPNVSEPSTPSPNIPEPSKLHPNVPEPSKPSHWVQELPKETSKVQQPYKKIPLLPEPPKIPEILKITSRLPEPPKPPDLLNSRQSIPPLMSIPLSSIPLPGEIAPQAPMFDPKATYSTHRETRKREEWELRNQGRSVSTKTDRRSESRKVYSNYNASQTLANSLTESKSTWADGQFKKLEETKRLDRQVEQGQDKGEKRSEERISPEVSSTSQEMAVDENDNAAVGKDPATLIPIQPVIKDKVSPTKELTPQEQEKRNFQVVAERMQAYESLDDNLYLVDRVRNKRSKEAKRMVCDCTLSKEEIANNEMGCGDECLNRLLLIECGSRCPLDHLCLNKRFQQRKYAMVEVFNAEEKGCGVRACEEVPQGTFIMEYIGEVFDTREFRRRRKEYAKSSSPHFYFMALRPDRLIDATRKGNISRFINHSCSPNAETQKWTVNGDIRIGFFATRSIAPYEEINFDYRLERYGREPQRCFCGTPECRGWLGEPPDQKTKEEKEEDKRREMRDRQRREGKRTFFEDMDLEDEIEKLTTRGLRNRQDTLNLSRLMVRCEESDSRLSLLKILESGEEASKRLFLDYHGLKLLWSWMVDVSASSKCTPLKIEILKTLQSLPITNKTQVTDSKVLSVVDRWNKAEGSSGAQRNLVKDVALDKMRSDGSEDSDTEASEGKETDPGSSSVSPEDSSSQDSTEASARKTDDDGADPEEVEHCPSTAEDEASVRDLSAHLVALWSELKEAFRIPKKERIEMMKEHEREVDKEYAKYLNQDGSRTQAFYDRWRYSSGSDKERDRDRRRDKWRSRRKEEEDEKGLSKEERRERRERFAMQVAKEDEEARQRKLQEEMWQLHLERCTLLGHDPYFTPIFDPSGQYYWDPGAKNWQAYVGPNGNLPVPASYGITQQDPDSLCSALPLGQLFLPGAFYPLPHVPVSEGEGEAGIPDGGLGNTDPSVSLDPASIPLPGEQPPQKCPTPVLTGEVPPPVGIGGDDPVGIKVSGKETPPLASPGAVTIVLPPRWKMARDAERHIYFYHTRTRHVQWQLPHEELHQELMTRYSITSDSESDLSDSDTESSSDSEDFSSDEEEGPDDDGGDHPLVQQGESVDEKMIRRPRGRRGHSEKLVQERVISPILFEDREEARRQRKEAKERAREEARKERHHLLRALRATGGTPSATAIKAEVEGGASEEAAGMPASEREEEEEAAVVPVHIEEPVLKLSRKQKSDPKTSQKAKSKERAATALADTSEIARKIKDNFRARMATYIVSVLNPYRKSDCREGRIMSNDDFKYLARKLTHFVMVKELKQLPSIEGLECSESVKHKTKEFVRKYMSKYGETFKRDPNDTKEY